MKSAENNHPGQDKESEDPKPRFLGVIEGYINSRYQPTRAFDPGSNMFRIVTSQEIVLELADMVDMELNDVADAMLHLGYRTIISDGEVGWLLQRRSD